MKNYKYAESLAAAAFYRLGYSVYTPSVGDTGCDMVVINKYGEVFKVQVTSSGVIDLTSKGNYIDVQYNKGMQCDLLVAVSVSGVPELAIMIVTDELKNKASHRLYLDTMDTVDKVEIF